MLLSSETSSSYVAGGRRSAHDQGNTFGDTVPEVDVYDFITDTWLAADDPDLPENLPEPRAAAATAVFNGEVVLAGGESGRSDLGYDDVHALDPATNQWQRLEPLNYRRHVSGQGIYVVAGSPKRGAGNQRNMEVHNQDVPAGDASVAGSLSSSSPAEIIFGALVAVKLEQVSGNQGVFVNSITLTGPKASDFVIDDSQSAFLVPNGGTHGVQV